MHNCVKGIRSLDCCGNFTYKLTLTILGGLGKYKARKDVATSKRYILKNRIKKLKMVLHYMTELPEFCS